MQTRREHLRALAGLGLGLWAAPLLAACGGSEGVASAGTEARGEGSRATPPASALEPAVAALGAFTGDLYARLAATPGNLFASPYSALVALGMTRVGARGRTATEMDAVLHSPVPAPTALDDGLNALVRALESRAGEVRRGDGSKATVVLDEANALYAQRDSRFEQAFLDELARTYAAGVRLVDFKADAEAARKAIDAWVSERTRGKIPELIPKDALDALTRLVLVNAIYLRAPWETPFADQATEERPFTRLDGSRTTASLMSLGEHLAYARGDGYQRVRLPYAGRGLAMTVIVPDAGRFAAVEAALAKGGFAEALAPVDERWVDLRLPRFRVRTQSSLADALAALGMPTAFSDAADFSGMSRSEHLQIGDVIHEAFVAVDEKGTEAAAATAVVMELSAAVAGPPPVELVVDRPFLHVIHDVDTRAPLFVGRVADPSQRAA